MYRDFGTVLFAVILGIVMVAIPLVIQKLIAPSNKTREKLETYECGEEADGSAWMQFNIRFYVFQTLRFKQNRLKTLEVLQKCMVKNTAGL